MNKERNKYTLRDLINKAGNIPQNNAVHGCGKEKREENT